MEPWERMLAELQAWRNIVGAAVVRFAEAKEAETGRIGAIEAIMRAEQESRAETGRRIAELGTQLAACRTSIRALADEVARRTSVMPRTVEEVQQGLRDLQERMEQTVVELQMAMGDLLGRVDRLASEPPAETH